MLSIEETIPKRSVPGLGARDIFFEPFNDINFYVEDEDQENLYLEILKKLFPNIQISQIFPLGGKVNVIAHAQDAANSARRNRSVYILDMDFDDLLGHLVKQDNIFYLDRYCIENFLLEENAIVQIALESQPKKKRQTIEREIGFPAAYSGWITALTPLFQLFFIVQRFNLGLKNCDQKPEAFSHGRKAWLINPITITQYEKEVGRSIRATGILKTDPEMAKLLKNIFSGKGSAESYISGKFLLNLVFHHLHHKVKLGNVSIDSLRYRLARNGSLKSLEPFKRRVNKFLRASGTGVGSK